MVYLLYHFCESRQLLNKILNKNTVTLNFKSHEDYKLIDQEVGTVRLEMSKQIHSSCSAEDPGWQHSGDNTKDQLRPVSQTISVAGAVCMDQEPTLHSSAIAFAGEMPERGGAQSLKYCTTQLPQLIGCIDLFDTM